jgi:putative RecB family exonuclease
VRLDDTAANPGAAPAVRAAGPVEVVVVRMAGSAYSFSRVSLFEQCARRFRYRYLDGVKDGFDSVEGFMGRRVHETVEWLFAERTRGRAPSAADAVRRFCRLWDEEILAARRRINVVKWGEDVETYRRSGAEILTRFYRERFVGDELDTVATEKHFSIPLGGRYVFQGYIDRVARDAAGRLHVIDYKTGRRVPEGFAGKEAEQVQAYALAIFADSAVDEVQLVLEFLRGGKTLRARIARDDAAAVEARLAEQIATVEEATVFPPNPSALCDWCGYNDICESYSARSRAGTNRRPADPQPASSIIISAGSQ